MTNKVEIGGADWLDDEKLGDQREAQRIDALAFAKLHTVFVSDGRGAALLKHWKDLSKRKIPVGASIDEYARAEAIRVFLQVIEDQIHFAAHDGRVGKS